jgi:hypothetical protein
VGIQAQSIYATGGNHISLLMAGPRNFDIITTYYGEVHTEIYIPRCEEMNHYMGL